MLTLICVLGCATQQAIVAEEKPGASSAVAIPSGQFADAHVHLIDFLQNGASDNRDDRF